MYSNMNIHWALNHLTDLLLTVTLIFPSFHSDFKVVEKFQSQYCHLDSSVVSVTFQVLGSIPSSDLDSYIQVRR